MADRGPKNPSSVIFWNDLENDEHLKTCSLAAKGLWDHHMLPMAARSAEPGIVILGDHPSRLADDLPLLLARAVGETPDTIAALLRELVNSRAASVDGEGRVYNRRMVREEAIRKARSAAGKRGADATNANRQKSGKPPGKDYGETADNQSGKDADNQSGKIPADDAEQNAAQEAITSDDEPADLRQNSDSDGGKPSDEIAGEEAGKTAPSSLLQDFSSSKIIDVTTEDLSLSSKSEGADAPEDEAFDQPLFLARGDVRLAVDLWNDGAEQAGWPKVQKITSKRRRLLIARLSDCGSIEGWKVALAKAGASSFLTGKSRRSADHANWRCTLDFILGEDQFTKLMEGGFDDAPSTLRVGNSDPDDSATARGIDAAFARRSIHTG